MVELFANSGDPDQTPHSTVSDLGLHCLPGTYLGVSSLLLVQLNKSILLRLDVSKTAGCISNKVDPDQMLHLATSDVGLHCLLRHVNSSN